MNLWGHRFSQKTNPKFEGFLPCPLINFQGRNPSKSLVGKLAFWEKICFSSTPNGLSQDPVRLRTICMNFIDFLRRFIGVLEKHFLHEIQFQTLVSSRKFGYRRQPDPEFKTTRKFASKFCWPLFQTSSQDLDNAETKTIVDTKKTKVFMIRSLGSNFNLQKYSRSKIWI